MYSKRTKYLNTMLPLLTGLFLIKFDLIGARQLALKWAVKWGTEEIPRLPMGQKPRGKWKHWGLPHF